MLYFDVWIRHKYFKVIQTANVIMKEKLDPGRDRQENKVMTIQKKKSDENLCPSF